MTVNTEAKDKPKAAPKAAAKTAPKTAPAAAPKAGKGGKFAAVLIRSAIQAERPVKETLFMLRLRQKNACVIMDANDSNKGMLFRVKDFVTYGEVSDDTVKLLEEKRAKKGGDTKIAMFTLHPPRGGFERKGIKRPFYLGGAIGYRGDKINDLLKRMI
ncbi:TPA: 50S ribosomal protein L30 [Candidatus Woesearchaeota archaeon]|nr:50S ribosomal protein L30 [Candidatus Woesearchaeota archaeon]